MQYCRLFVCVFLLSVFAACNTPTSSEGELAAPATPVSVTMDTIAQGVTTDGYHFLGPADAPVVIQFYSDFF